MAEIEIVTDQSNGTSTPELISILVWNL